MKTACDRGRMNKYIIFLILLLLFAENSLAYSPSNKDAFEPISLTHNFKVRDLTIPTIVVTPKIVREDRFDIIKWLLNLLDKILGPT